MANLKDINYGIGKYLEASDASDIPDIGTNRKNLDLLNFKVATNNAYALYNFKDGMIDAYQDQTGVDLTASTGEIYNSTDKTFDSADPNASTGFLVTGGLQTFTVPAGVTSVEIKCFGASGNTADAGNGGFSKGNLSTSGGTQYAVVVGEQTADPNSNTYSDTPYGGGGRGYNQTSAGGLSGVYTGTSAISFTSTTDQARAIIIAGGGGGRGGFGNAWGGVGGGAGNPSSATFNHPAANINTTDSAYENQSFKTGSGGTQSSAGSYPGMNSGSVMKGGDGGTGNEDAGGGGGYYGGAGGSAATSGGGGSGYVGTQNGLSSGATYYAWDGSPSGTMTKKSDPDWPGNNVAKVLFKYSLVNDISLVSNTQTAQAAPTTGRLMLYEQDVDAITLNTDLKGYVSRDNGTTYTQTTLTDEGYINTYRGIDSYTKLMLHCDGANAGTTFTDSSLVPKTVTRNQGTTVTAIKKFGTAAGYFDGSGTYPTGNLVVANDSDFDFTGDFTVDFWLYLPSNAASLKNQKILGCSLYSGGWQGWHIKKDNANLRLNFEGTSSLGGFNTQFSSDVAVETWTHVAVVRSGTTTSGYLNGTSAMSFSQSGTVQTSGHDFVVGMEHNDAWWDYPVMHIDEIRISKGIARWTSNFTAPDLPYNIADRILSGSVDISGQPAGSNMKYKVTTHNSKSLKLHGASLLWT